MFCKALPTSLVCLLTVIPSLAQLIDKTKAPNPAGAGIAKSLPEQIGPGRGDVNTPNSSLYLISRDPFRSIRRGRQLFQRKFSANEGAGPIAGNGSGNIATNLAIGAGLTDSCAACHGRPRGSAGFGGDVATRPDSRDAPHLFGLGLKEMLADEMTTELREHRRDALADARRLNRDIRRNLVAKGIAFGTIVAKPNGQVDSTGIDGVDADLRVKPFFAHGATVSMREFIVGALNDEMGLQAVDPDLLAASRGARVTTPSGFVLDGALDPVPAPKAATVADDPDGDGFRNEIPTSLVDHFEFYLLNYFKAATGDETQSTERGRRLFGQVGCANCHVASLRIDRDRRVADVETEFDPRRGIFNRLFATAVPLFNAVDDGSGRPSLKRPKLGNFPVRNIFTDFKRHDLGPNFWERNYDGTFRKEFLTTPLWGVGSTGPYGHDGRSMTLDEVIRRHGGEAQRERDRYIFLPDTLQHDLLDFLQSLILFPPEDTASSLDPGDRSAANFPQFGHGSIKLGALFVNPADPE